MNWNQLLSSMNEEEFKTLRMAVSSEDNRRIELSLPNMPEPNEAELSQWREGKHVDAIQAYRTRTTILSLAQVKRKFDTYIKR